MRLRKVRMDGKTVDLQVARMIREAERHCGNLIVVQGSYHPGVGASGGTHDKGGVVDLSVRGLSMTQINRRVRWLRKVGFAAWYRPPLAGVWGPHIHAVAVGFPNLAPLAAAQVGALRRGEDGLRGNAPDRHRNMHISVHTWAYYKRHIRPRAGR